MAFQVKRTGATEYGRHVKALIAGEPGSGKTRGVRSWPNVFIASAEAGMMSVAADALRHHELTSTEELKEILVALRQAPEVRAERFDGPVDTFVVDTLDEIQRMLVRERLRSEGREAMSQPDWGWLGDKLRAVVRACRNLDMHVIFTAHLKTYTDEDTGKSTIKPQIQGAMGDELPGYVDLSLLLRAAPTTRVEDGETVRDIRRFYQTYPDAQHPWIKDRSGQLPQEFDIDFATEYDRLYASIYGNLQLPESRTVAEVAKPEPVVVTAPAAVVEEAAEPPASDDLVAALEASLTRPKPATTDESSDTDAAVAALTGTLGGEAMTPAEAEATVDVYQKAEAPSTAAEPAPEPKRRRRKDVKEEPAPVDPQLALAEKAKDCADCGKSVADEDQLDRSELRFKKPLCADCFKTQKTNK